MDSGEGRTPDHLNVDPGTTAHGTAGLLQKEITAVDTASRVRQSRQEFER
jgi:hypothetical protein